MNKKHYFILTVLLSFISCEKDNRINNPLQEENHSKQQTRSYNNSLLYDEVYEIRNGKEVDITETQHVPKIELYEIAALNKQYVYLGSTLTKESINTGMYRPIGFENELKSEIRVSFSLPVKSKKTAPTQADFMDTIIEAIGDKDFSGKQSQSITYSMKEFDYYNEIRFAFGSNVDIARLFSVNININHGRKERRTGIFVDFSQIYFSAYMNIPSDGNIFIDENTKNKYLQYCPIYISSINFGRKGVLVIESDVSYNELSVAIRTAFNAIIVNGQLSLDHNTKKIISEASISICILGGDGSDAVKTVKGFEEFQNFIINGGVYSKEVYGVPISFTGSWALDNSVFVNDYQTR